VPKTPGKPPFSIVSGETVGILPPRKLGPHGLALWNRIQGEYGIADTGGVEILCQICQSLDRAESLAEAIERDGPVVYIPSWRSEVTSKHQGRTELQSFHNARARTVGLERRGAQARARPSAQSHRLEADLA
jgi:hypothetical protein